MVNFARTEKTSEVLASRREIVGYLAACQRREAPNDWPEWSRRLCARLQDTYLRELRVQLGVELRALSPARILTQSARTPRARRRARRVSRRVVRVDGDDGPPPPRVVGCEFSRLAIGGARW
jgi:hypothetical protein